MFPLLFAGQRSRFNIRTVVMIWVPACVAAHTLLALDLFDVETCAIPDYVNLL